MPELNVNIINGLIIIGGALIALATGGGVLAMLTLLRTRKAEVERAFLSLPPETQAEITRLINTVNGVVMSVGEVLKYLVDVTDGDPNVPETPETLLAKARVLEAQANALLSTGTGLRDSSGRM